MRCKQNHFGQVRGTKKATLFLYFFCIMLLLRRSEEHHFVEMFHPWLNSRTICSRAWCLKVFSLTDLFLVVWSVTFSVNFWLRWTFQFLRNTQGHLPFVDYRKKYFDGGKRLLYYKSLFVLLQSQYYRLVCAYNRHDSDFFVRAPQSSFYPDQNIVLQDRKFAEWEMLQTCAP